jgi:hypothetical protein
MARSRSLNGICPCITNYVDSIITRSTFFRIYFNILIDGAYKLILVQARKPHGRVGVWLHAFLTSASDEGLWSALRSGRFIPTERAVSVH